MKVIITSILITISTFGYSQLFYLNNNTWLYEFSKSETYSNTWTPKGSYNGNSVYSIYYAKSRNWTFVGKILVPSVSQGSVYFRNGYRIAFQLKQEKPTEIIFETKQWKVD
jgi:hypothetical protein